jgi:hypoxia up-regulated 1
LDGLEKTLRDHERWLVEWVEKQKVIKSNEDPVIETTEMKARAKVLEQHLQRLWRRKVPKVKPKRTSTTESVTATRSAVDQKETTTTEDGGEGVYKPPAGGDDEQVPLTGRIVDDL